MTLAKALELACRELTVSARVAEQLARDSLGPATKGIHERQAIEYRDAVGVLMDHMTI